MLEWDEIKSDFSKDGSLRDIYIVGMEADDYPKFFDFIGDYMEKVSFTFEGKKLPIPQTFSEARETTEETAPDDNGRL